MIEDIKKFYKMVVKNPSTNYPPNITKAMVKRWIRNGIIESVKHQDIYGRFYFNKRWLVSLDELIDIECKRIEKKLYYSKSEGEQYDALTKAITYYISNDSVVLTKEALDEAINSLIEKRF